MVPKHIMLYNTYYLDQIDSPGTAIAPRLRYLVLKDLQKTKALQLHYPADAQLVFKKVFICSGTCSIDS